MQQSSFFEGTDVYVDLRLECATTVALRLRPRRNAAGLRKSLPTALSSPAGNAARGATGLDSGTTRQPEGRRGTFAVGGGGGGGSVSTDSAGPGLAQGA